jgi:hypothetical protein
MTTKAWIVFEDKKRDYSAAEEFGEIKVIYSSINRDYDPESAIKHARRTLRDYEENDFLLMSGDPALCAICVCVVAEKFGVCKVLSWSRDTLNYTQKVLDFD